MAIDADALLAGVNFDDAGNIVKEEATEVAETEVSSETEETVEETTESDVEAVENGEEVADPADSEEKPKPGSWKALRLAKESLEADLNSYKERAEPILAKAEELGGEAVIDTALNLYDKFVGPEASPEAFVQTLRETSPNQYGGIVDAIVEQHKDAIVERLTGYEGVTTDDIEEFRQFKEMGGIDGIKLFFMQGDDGIPTHDENGNELSQAQRDEIKQARESFQAVQALKKQAEETIQRQKAEAEQKEYESKKTSFDNNQFSVIDTVITNLGWNTNGVNAATDEEKAALASKAELGEILRTYVTTKFNEDAKAVDLYRRALGHHINGETQLANSLSKAVQKRLGELSQHAAKLLSDVKATQRQEKEKQVQQATKTKKEVSAAGGITPQSAGVQAQKQTKAWENLDEQLEEAFRRRGLS